MGVYTGHWSISSAVPVSGGAEFPVGGRVSGRAEFPVSDPEIGISSQLSGERNFQAGSGLSS